MQLLHYLVPSRNDFRMTREHSVYLVIAATIFTSTFIAGDMNLHRVTRSPTKAMTAELLIVCDKEFGDFFGQDSNKIADYWAMHIWDANMKFKTLTKVDITFRLVQLITIKDIQDQPFIEEARRFNSSTFLSQVLQKFAGWAYSQKVDNQTNFDIAILVTKAGTSVLPHRNYIQSACKWRSSVAVIHFENPWQRYCSLFEQPLASIMGGVWDSGTSAYEGCKSKGYIMGWDEVCNEKRFFFSKCTDEAIEKFVMSHNVECLLSNDFASSDVIANNSGIVHPPSIRDQCALLVGSNDVTISEDENMCIRTKCFEQYGGGNLTHQFYPFDNSPCGDGKICFRGRCLLKGYQIRNVGTGTCLHMRNRFEPNDYPKMATCEAAPTQLDELMILDKGPLGLFLASPYTTEDGDVSADKCLLPDPKNDTMQYTHCTPASDKKWFGWKFVAVEGTRREFLLYHLLTKSCAFVDSHQSVKLSQSCDTTDEMMCWKFHERVPMPEAWLSGEENEIFSNLSFSEVRLVTMVGAVVIFVIGIVVGVCLLLVLLRVRKRLKAKASEGLENHLQVSYVRGNGHGGRHQNHEETASE